MLTDFSSCYHKHNSRQYRAPQQNRGIFTKDGSGNQENAEREGKETTEALMHYLVTTLGAYAGIGGNHLRAARALFSRALRFCHVTLPRARMMLHTFNHIQAGGV